MTRKRAFIGARRTHAVIAVTVAGGVALLCAVARADVSTLFFDGGTLARSIPGGLALTTYAIDKPTPGGTLTLKKRLDASSPPLQQACADQTLIPRVRLVTAAQTLVFENAICKSYRIPPPNGEPPSETVRLQFEKMTDLPAAAPLHEAQPHPTPIARPSATKAP